MSVGSPRTQSSPAAYISSLGVEELETFCGSLNLPEQLALIQKQTARIGIAFRSARAAHAYAYTYVEILAVTTALRTAGLLTG